MKSKNVIFSTLEKIEKIKLKKELIKIKQLKEKNGQDIQQLKLLCTYEKEYIQRIYMKVKLGVCIHQWKNYNNFIFILQKIIKDNQSVIKQNNKIIEKSLKCWQASQNRIKLWQNLNIKNRKKMLKMEKNQENKLNNCHIQLTFLKRG